MPYEGIQYLFIVVDPDLDGATIIDSKYPALIRPVDDIA
jgi:hypothetical protein